MTRRGLRVRTTGAAIRGATSGVAATAPVLALVSETARQQRQNARHIDLEAGQLATIAGSQAIAAEEMATSTEQQAHVVAGISRELFALPTVAREMQTAVKRLS